MTDEGLKSPDSHNGAVRWSFPIELRTTAITPWLAPSGSRPLHARSGQAGSRRLASAKRFLRHYIGSGSRWERAGVRSRRQVHPKWNMPALLGYGARWLMGGAILAVSHRAAFMDCPGAAAKILCPGFVETCQSGSGPLVCVESRAA